MNQQRLKQWNRTQLNILHPQPLENEPPVSQTEAGYQKIRAELHEARKNIPPKTRLMLVNNWQPRAVNMSKTSATRTIRGGFITITAPQIRVKKKKWCRRKQPAAEPEAVTRNADGTFDVSALFLPPQTRPKNGSQNRKRWRNAEREQPAGNGWRYRTGNYNGRWIRYNFIAQTTRQWRLLKN